MLVKCPDCGREISTAATACPQCGRPCESPPRVLPATFLIPPRKPPTPVEQFPVLTFGSRAGVVLFAAILFSDLIYGLSLLAGEHTIGDATTFIVIGLFAGGCLAAGRACDFIRDQAFRR